MTPVRALEHFLGFARLREELRGGYEWPSFSLMRMPHDTPFYFPLGIAKGWRTRERAFSFLPGSLSPIRMSCYASTAERLPTWHNPKTLSFFPWVRSHVCVCIRWKGKELIRNSISRNCISWNLSQETTDGSKGSEAFSGWKQKQKHRWSKDQEKLWNYSIKRLLSQKDGSFRPSDLVMLWRSASSPRTLLISDRGCATLPLSWFF